MCCNGHLNLRMWNAVCCGDRTYDPTVSVCCGGELTLRRGGNHRCCGTRLVPFNAEESCCGDATYRWDSKECCNGVVADKGTCQIKF